MGNKKRVSRIWQYGKKYIPMFLLSEFCILISYAVAVIFPLNTRSLIDDVLFAGNHSMLKGVSIHYVILFVISTINNIVYAYVWQTLNNQYVVDIKIDLYRKALYSTADFLSGMNSGDLMSRIENDTDQFIFVIQRNLFHFINSLLLCASILYIISKTSVVIVVILVVSIILPIVITRLFGKILENYSKENRSISGGFTGKIFEYLKGMREIRLYNANPFIKSKIEKILRVLIKIQNKVRWIEFATDKSIFLINLITSIIIYSISVGFIYSNKMTIGTFVIIIEYMVLLHRKFNWMLRIYLDWHNRKISIDRVNEIFEKESERSGGIEIKGIDCIEFKNVSFSYDEKAVLNHLNIKIDKGEKIAIVGASGVGKTTLVNLILRFYTANQGEIRINDIDIRDIDYKSLRNNIGVVSQDVLLFEESLRFNITLGSNAYTDNEIYQICEAVGINNIVSSLPLGLDTIIGKGDNHFSKGQIQRFLIARVLLYSKEWIVLDEPTSALDRETEKLIFKQLGTLNNTLIIISHDLEVLRTCSKIILLRDGEIESVGSHECLLKNCDLYRSIFKGQL